MTGVTVLVVVLAGMSAMEAVHLHQARRRRLYWEHKTRVEQTRGHFAGARNELLRVVRDGELSVDSETFRQIYGIQTFIMRRPDQYVEISEQLTRALWRHNGERATWIDEEAPTWTPRVRDVMSQTAQGIGLVIWNYSRIRRAIMNFRKMTKDLAIPAALAGIITAAITGFLNGYLEALEARRKPGLPELRRARQRIAQASEPKAA